MNHTAKSTLAGVIGMVVVIALAGCSGNTYGGHTQKWYEHHLAAAHKENLWCAKQSFDTQIHSEGCNGAALAKQIVENRRALRAEEHGAPLLTLPEVSN